MDDRLQERQKSRHRSSCASGLLLASRWWSSAHSRYTNHTLGHLACGAHLHSLNIMICCSMLAAHPEEDCTAVQDPGSDLADLQQGNRAKAGPVISMCRHRPHCSITHGCLQSMFTTTLILLQVHAVMVNCKIAAGGGQVRLFAMSCRQFWRMSSLCIKRTATGPYQMDRL